MKYRYLIFDVDGTLLNFSSAYSCAQRAVAKALGIGFSSEFVRVDEKLSWELWDEFGLSRVENETIQENYHSLYDAYLRKHFTSVAQAFGVNADVDMILKAYYAALSSSRELMEPDTLDVYRTLGKQHKMVIATNGMAQVQRSRLLDFLPTTTALFISEESGCIKPSKAFFKHMTDSLGCAPAECLMIGDSLSSDIAGAKSVGMAACWYDCKRKGSSNQRAADYYISKLGELLLFPDFSVREIFLNHNRQSIVSAERP